MSSFGLAPAFPPFELPRLIDVAVNPVDSDSVYIASQVGPIHRVNRKTGESTVFVDMTKKVNYQNNGELGLLGTAFDPSYGDSNNHFYIYYSVANSDPIRNVLSRFDTVPASGATDTVKDRVVDQATECVLMTFNKAYANHNGGFLDFDSKGNLYLALGDGGGSNSPDNNGLKMATLHGKIIRIIPTRNKECSLVSNYTIPSDNPFANNTEGILEEIYAYGLRNPFTCSLESSGGVNKLFCGDVGQNAYEEIDEIVSGGNYGWEIAEGDGRFNNPKVTQAEYDALLVNETYVRPIIDYRHSSSSSQHERTLEAVFGQSITYGHIYRGRAIPSLVGAHLFSDFVQPGLYGLFLNGKGYADKLFTVLTGNIPAFSRIRRDIDGESLFLAYSYDDNPNQVLKLNNSQVEISTGSHVFASFHLIIAYIFVASMLK